VTTMEGKSARTGRYARRSRAASAGAGLGAWAPIILASPCPVWALDLSRPSEGSGSRWPGAAVDANPAAVAFHGAADKAQLLASFDRLLGPGAGSFSAACETAAAEGALGRPFEAEVSTIAGSRRAVVASVAPAPGCERSLDLVLATFEDISELRRAEAVGRARLALMDYSQGRGVDELMRSAIDLAEKLTGSSIGFFHIVADDGRAIVLQAWSTRTLESFCTAAGKGEHYDIDQAGVWVECARRGEPVIHNDYASLPGRKGLPPGHAPVIRELAVPILRGGRIAAIIGVGNKETPYEESDASAAARFADFAWEIVERKRTEETLRCLATSFASLAGKDFFDAAARRLAEFLFVDAALIALRAPGSDSPSLLGASGPGGAEALDGLESWAGSGRAAVRELGVVGGAAVIAAAMDSRPLPCAERLDAAIGLFKDRILAEVARAEAERALETLNAELEEKVRARSLELERAAKLAVLGRLVAGIAHELSTPLAAIASANESLGDSMGMCIPGLPGFLAGAGPDELGLFSRLIAAIVSNKRARDESELRSRKRRWRAVAKAAGVAGAEGAVEMLAEIGDDPSDEELVEMLRVPRGAEVVAKAFLIARSVRASSVIGAAAQKASRTVRALKSYAHEAPSDALEEVDLKESVESTLSLYFGSLPPGIRLTTSFEATPPALAQPDRLSQVWANLVGNAIQASPGTARIEIHVRRDGDRALVSVEDEGPGISEEAKARIFTPFYTTKPPGEGLGLGLDICKRIVDETGGSIRFESEPGRTVFTVALPLADGRRP
jgi:signal transduction histidine kinase